MNSYDYDILVGALSKYNRQEYTYIQLRNIEGHILPGLPEYKRQEYMTMRRHMIGDISSPISTSDVVMYFALGVFAVWGIYQMRR